ncbi:lysozyme c-1 [Phlebotomus argentipes]|uniref:lysozyme c-1 n=1 Tax=Phlebotomus argentipes TaxID=94469 RepID=UPI002892EDBB|nr:lysozyme c-1 [Phlebotomus argentipes]
MKLFAFVLLGLFLGLCDARRYDECELARELAQYFPRSQLPDWICLVQSESNFDTRAMNKHNKDGSWDWGLFQINDRYWCSGHHHERKNICGIDCETMLNSGLGYQINCVKKIHKIHGFEGWEGWKAKCMGRNLPSLDHCFNTSAYFFTMEYDNLPELLTITNGLGLLSKN